MLKKLMAIVMSLVVVFSFVGCSSNDSKEASTDKGPKTIKIATSDQDLEEMLKSVEGEFLEKGYKMEIRMFAGDIVAPNTALSEGSVDANFYQHVPYMNDFNKSKGTNLVAVGESIFYSKMGIYSQKIKSLNEVKDGMEIGISSDATNRTRALLFMENMGLIKLKKGLEVYTKLDIVENPKNLKIVELDVAMIPKTLPDLDMVIIYPYDMELAGYNIKPIAMDPPEVGKKYGLVLSVDKKNENAPWAKTLAELMKGEKTKEVVKKYYKDTGAHISEY
ncbi:MAG: MetQ/NlpA family ABC transporter substrate-binding protein [Clostridium sp.]